MIARALAWLLLKIAGKEEREMLVRLYAGEIIMGRYRKVLSISVM